MSTLFLNLMPLVVFPSRTSKQGMIRLLNMFLPYVAKSNMPLASRFLLLARSQ
jgi:hypothetical protein